LYPLDLNLQPEQLSKWAQNSIIIDRSNGKRLKTWLNGQEVAYVVMKGDRLGFIGLQVA